MSRLMLFVLASIFFPLEPACCQEVQSDSVDGQRHVERLSKLCEVWGCVAYLHPHLAYKEIDWDDALISTLPQVMRAEKTEAFAEAVQSMLDRLDDPVTRVVFARSNEKAASDITRKNTDDRQLTSYNVKTLIVDLSHPSVTPGMVFDLGAEIDNADEIVFDLRGAPADGTVIRRISAFLRWRPVAAPAHRYRVHSGYKPQYGQSSGGYFSAFEVEAMQRFNKAKEGKRRPIAFIVDRQSELSPLVLGLHRAGLCYIVAEGQLSEESMVLQESIRLTDDIEVRIRTSELVDKHGFFVVRPDVELPENNKRTAENLALKHALRLVQNRPQSQRTPTPISSAPSAIWRQDKTYRDMTYPNVEYRIGWIIRKVDEFRVPTFVVQLPIAAAYSPLVSAPSDSPSKPLLACITNNW